MAYIDQHILTDQSDAFVSAAQAARRLGVKLPTLYAYVSRGLLRSRRHAEGREHRYLRSDVERLRSRRRERRIPADPVSGALHWGEPILESSISAITEAGPLYRGHLAVDLAKADTPFEAVAELLWSGALPETRPIWHGNGLGVSAKRLRLLLPESGSPLATLSLLVPALGARDPERFDTRAAAVLPRARKLIRRMAAAVALADAPERVEAALDGDVARALAVAAHGRADRDRVRAINRALVLLADHELNVSAFAARVVASAGADLYACLSAALAALSGPRHGGHVERVEALVAEIGSPERAGQIVHERTRRGEYVPGFGHPLYPAGDPRARPLLEVARALAPRSPAVRTIFALIDVMRDAGRPAPTVDAAIVAVAAALGLPRGSAVLLFAIGRTAGWVAHVLEQYEAGFLIRPRALYRPR